MAMAIFLTVFAFTPFASADFTMRETATRSRYIDDCGARIEIRVPYVPDYNDTQMEKIAEFLSTLKHLVRVRVLPYHNYAAFKYDALSLKTTLPMRLPTDEEIAKARAIFTSVGIRC